MNPSDFDYYLPDNCIAQEPLPDRAASRMLVLDRARNTWEDHLFREFPGYLRTGDCLVLNDSKVFPARLFGHRAGVHSLTAGKNNPKRKENLSGEVEVFLIQPLDSDALTWQALVRPGRKMKTGERIRFEGGLVAEILERGAYGERVLRFEAGQHIYELLNSIGHIPLPPYIKRADTELDRERYQTVFARQTGSVAAPTAGLHFSTEILDQCRQSGAQIAYVTLHVGLGTFQPVREGRLHAERFAIDPQNEARIRAAERALCVGTTSVRALESMLLGKAGETDLFIQPGFEFQKTGAMLTNFHLPQSSLLMLVSAFAGQELVFGAYRHALASGYRFYSYGDCMLIL